ncbi:MAG: tyrosine-type recombinase/integrase, partial [Paracoccaceae bacterium]
ARVLTADKRYVQHCIGPALDLGRGAITAEHAISLAFDWFDDLEVGGNLSVAGPVVRTDTVNFSPFGGVYTVGHALHDFTIWTKLARSAGGHYNNLVLINRHITSDLIFVPLEDFSARHLQILAVRVIERRPKYGFQAEQGNVTLEQLSADELRRRKRTYNSLITIMRVAFQLAWESGHIQSERPWRSLKRVSVNHSPRLTFLNRDECRRLLERCTPALRKLCLAPLYSGCRVGELAGLRVEDVAYQVYGLRIGPFKRSPSRFVFLPDEGMAFFLSCCEGKTPDELVLRSDMGKPWRRQHTNLFRRAVSQAELPRTFVFHGLRHTYASDLIRAGVSLDIVARQFGHAGTDTVQLTYGHLAEQFREEEIRRKFTPLDAEQQRIAASRSDQLSTLWKSVQAVDWRRYGERPVSANGLSQSSLRTPIEILKAFGPDLAR